MEALTRLEESCHGNIVSLKQNSVANAWYLSTPWNMAPHWVHWIVTFHATGQLTSILWRYRWHSVGMSPSKQMNLERVVVQKGYVCIILYNNVSLSSQFRVALKIIVFWQQLQKCRHEKQGVNSLAEQVISLTEIGGVEISITDRPQLFIMFIALYIIHDN